MNPRNHDYTEASFMLRDLCSRLLARYRYKGRRRCGRSESSYKITDPTVRAIRDMAWHHELPEFAPIPGEVLPAPVSPPMYPANEVLAVEPTLPRLSLALDWREHAVEIPVVRIGELVEVT